MKKWPIIALALLVSTSALSEDKEGVTVGSGGTSTAPPIAAGQLLGSSDTLQPEWETLGGGNGNCYIQRNGPGSYSLMCPNFGSGGGGGGSVPGNIPQVVGFAAPDINSAVTITGDMTLAGGGPNTYNATVLRLNGVVPGGSCGASEFVNAISNGGVPTCAPWEGGGPAVGPTPPPGPVAGDLWVNTSGSVPTLEVYDGTAWVVASNPSPANTSPTPPTNPIVGQLWYNSSTTPATLNIWDGAAWVAVGGEWAPVSNPTGGINNYAPIASPTFSGLITANAATFINGVTTMPTLQFTTNTVSQIQFPTAATPQGSLTSGNVMGVTLAQGARYNGTQWIASNITSAGVTLVGGNINFYSNSGLTINSAFTPTLIGSIRASGTDLPGPLSVSGTTFGGACTPGEFVTTLSANGAVACASPPGGGNFAPLVNPTGGQNNYAPIASPSFTGSVGIGVPAPTNGDLLDVGTIALFSASSGITFGEGSTTMTFQLNTVSLNDVDNNFNGDTSFSVLNNNNTGPNASAGLFAYNGSTQGVGQLVHYGNGVPLDNVYMAPNATLIADTGNYGIIIGTSGGAGNIYMRPGGWNTGVFQTVPFAGLNITNNGSTGLMVGDFSASSVGAGNFNLVAGAYYNGSSWISTSSASTIALINNIPGQGIGFYVSPGYPPGQSFISWNQQLRVNSQGIFFNHMGVDQSTAEPPPWVSANATIVAGSSDSFGAIVANSWPVNLNFGQAFTGTAICVATTANGIVGVMYLESNSQTGVVFGCRNWGNDPAAGDCWVPLRFNYQCADLSYNSNSTADTLPRLTGHKK